jgi:excisionase family DNA binding protein
MGLLSLYQNKGNPLPFGSVGSRSASIRTASAMATSRRVDESLLTPAQVAAAFRVDPKTVTRWAMAGKLTALRTLGGHRRYRAAEVERLLGGGPRETATSAVDGS